MENLTQLFLKYSQWTDKERLHRYGQFYESWVSQLKGVRSILELGCNEFGGGDLLSFSDRFPDAKVIGIDICDGNLVEEVRRNKNIEIVPGDTYCWETVEQIRNRYSMTFDLMIDDCLHTPGHQSAAFELWSSLLSPGGLYVIEDVSDINELSQHLAIWNEQWDVRIGDVRSQANDDSVLFGLNRKTSPI